MLRKSSMVQTLRNRSKPGHMLSEPQAKDDLQHDVLVLYHCQRDALRPASTWGAPRPADERGRAASVRRQGQGRLLRLPHRRLRGPVLQRLHRSAAVAPREARQPLRGEGRRPHGRPRGHEPAGRRRRRLEARRRARRRRGRGGARRGDRGHRRPAAALRQRHVHPDGRPRDRAAEHPPGDGAGPAETGGGAGPTAARRLPRGAQGPRPRAGPRAAGLPRAARRHHARAPRGAEPSASRAGHGPRARRSRPSL